MPVGLKKMEMQQVKQAVWPVNGMVLYFQKNEREYYMVRRVFLGNKLTVGSVNGKNKLQKILESHGRNKYVQA